MLRRLVLPCLLALTLAAAPASASPAQLRQRLASALAPVAGATSAYVLDLESGNALFASRADARRSPASVEKLYTTSTALLRFGADHRFATTVVGDGRLEADGTWRGDLYLHGHGDPTFGSRSFAERAYGGGGTVQELAHTLAGQGIDKVSGKVLGDESYLDLRRGTPAEGYALSSEVEGELSGLAYDRGLTSGGGGFQSDPPGYAAHRLADALRAEGVHAHAANGQHAAPDAATELASTASLPLATVARLTNRPSDNFLAETLVKDLGAEFGAHGSTAAGAGVVRGQLAQFGIDAHVVDGSGLTRRDKTTGRQVVTLLQRIAKSAVAAELRDSLAVAGRSGTLSPRMRGTAAAGRCQAKTGTLIGVSGLAGYCDARSGHRLAFAFLMNGADVNTARSVQDRMAIAIAAYKG